MSWWYRSLATLARERGLVIRTERVAPGRWRATALAVGPDPHNPGDYLVGESVGCCEASSRYRAYVRLVGPLLDYTTNPNRVKDE